MSVQLSCAKSNYQKSSSIEKENLKIGRYCYSVHTALRLRIKLLLLAFHVRYLLLVLGGRSGAIIKVSISRKRYTV